MIAVVFADKEEKRADRGIAVVVVFADKEEKRADRGIPVVVVFADKEEKRADRGIPVVVVFADKEEKRADRGIAVVVVFADKEEKRADSKWLQAGCSTLGELDKGSGVLHVWYLLLDGLATAISSCPRSFQPQTLTTLFQLLRDTANVPGEGAGVVLSFVMFCPCSFQPQTLTLLPAGEGHRQYAR